MFVSSLGHPIHSPISVGTVVISLGTRRSACEADDVRLVAWLRLNGALPLLPLHTLMSRTLGSHLLILLQAAVN